MNELFIPTIINPQQTIILKVMFKRRKSNWRKIELKATNTLQDLHSSIQNALRWDNDHLYSFFMDNKMYSTDIDSEYTCPFEPGGRKTADKAEIGFFGLRKGQKFAYLFDFGDNHEFEIEVLDFATFDTKKQYPLLLESHGKGGEQYPDYE